MTDIGQSIVQSIISRIQQPTADFNATKAATNASNSSAGLTSQEATNAQLLQSGDQQQANRVSILNAAGSQFKSSPDSNAVAYKTNPKGTFNYVNPKTYNDALGSYTQNGGNLQDFEEKFGAYIDPNNINYDTPDAINARKALPLVKNVIDSYRALSNPDEKSGLISGPGQLSGIAAAVPVLGDYLKQNGLAAEEAHNKFLAGQVGNIRQIAGAGQGSGFRFNTQELNNITGLLPNAYDNKSVADYKVNELNKYMESNMGVSLKDLYGK